MSMLQSPKKRTQRHRRLTSVSENPILEAKQDTKRQQVKQRQQPNGPVSYPTPSRHQGGYQQQQHRRQHSIPDALTLGSATAPSPRKSNANAYPARTLNGLGIAVNSDDQDQKHLTRDNNINNFFASQLQRPRTPPGQANISKSASQGWS